MVQNSFGEDSFAWGNSEGTIQIETRCLPDSAGVLYINNLYTSLKLLLGSTYISSKVLWKILRKSDVNFCFHFETLYLTGAKISLDFLVQCVDKATTSEKKGEMKKIFLWKQKEVCNLSHIKKFNS